MASATKVPPPSSWSDLVVSHHLAGFLRLRPPTAHQPKLLPPTDRGRGLVASRCRSWGSPRVPPRPARPTPDGAARPDRRVPRDAIDPSKKLTRPQPCRVTATCRASLGFTLRLPSEALLRCRAPVRSPPLPAARALLLPGLLSPPRSSGPRRPTRRSARAADPTRGSLLPAPPASVRGRSSRARRRRRSRGPPWGF
jgi:hypothetical protein